MQPSANTLSLDYLKSLPLTVKQAFLSDLKSLDPRDAAPLWYDWPFWARPEQRAPGGDWQYWIYNAGRGTGKTRTAAEWIRDGIENQGWMRVALVARTLRDARDTMIEGISGLLAVCPPWNMPRWEPSNSRLIWPNGAVAYVYSAEEPESLRGPQFDAAWCDELASWKYPDRTWDNLMFTMRNPDAPVQVCITTTPRPIPLYKKLLAMPGTVVTNGTTYDNLDNLNPIFIEQIIKPYENTRIGRQELLAELLDDSPDALWRRAMIDDLRVMPDAVPDLRSIVIAVDPAMSNNATSDETGIIVVARGVNDHAYVLDDLSLRGTPDEWGGAVVEAFYKYNANRVIGETNNGGALVQQNVKMAAWNRARVEGATVQGRARRLAVRVPSIPFQAVHATTAKRTRAEPAVTMYEQGRVHHVGMHSKLEDQMCTWSPGDKLSPDHLDALVWGLFALFVEAKDKRMRSW